MRVAARLEISRERSSIARGSAFDINVFVRVLVVSVSDGDVFGGRSGGRSGG